MNKNVDYIELQQSRLIDLFKFLAAVLVVANHTLTLQDCGGLGFYFQNYIVRFDVPFFLIVSGYLVFKKDTIFSSVNIMRHAVKLFKMYLIWSLIYFAWHIFEWHSRNNLSPQKLWYYIIELIYRPQAYHLWYLLACAYVFLFFYVCSKWMNKIERG